MLNVTVEWLKKLLKSETGSLPVSSLSKSAKAEIESLRSIDIIDWKRSGAGAKYFIVDKSAIEKLINSNSYEGDLSKLSSKAKAVALYGNAHKGNDDSMLLLLSAVYDGVIWNNGRNTLNLYGYSSQLGVASLVVKIEDDWTSNKPIALVENLDLLIYTKLYFEKISFDGAVLFYSGHVSGKLLKWLNHKKRGTSYIMFPDYDIVGLNNYIRVKKVLGNMLTMYIPDNLLELLSDHGDENTLIKTQASRTLIEQSVDKDVLFVYNAILNTGNTLHQEGLML
ncbi:MAG: hypothetical protein KAH20_10685 [Methylococcales bacterium]|nr:hypothetical protein [Methylococcales bacterium]